MEIIRNPERNQWATLLRRPAIEQESLRGRVKEIMDAVRDKGDTAVRRYTQKFDQVYPEQLLVTEEELKAAAQKVPEALKIAIKTAQRNIATFHEAQKPQELQTETSPGITCRQKPVPISAVGLYIPGGTAPLFSTVLMLAVPAQIAGCSEIVMCSPPDKHGNIHPATLYAASIAGVQKIMKAGGVQAVAAMTHGTESIPSVHKIFGPGNQYVTMAKQMAAMEGLAIDMPAGPSEVLVVADKTTPPRYAAIDLLSQAEHGADSQVVLVADNEESAKAIANETDALLQTLPRRQLASQSLEHSRIIVMEDRGTLMELVNHYAPEHLILSTEDAETLAEQVIHAGSVFIGRYTPESLGDYASGTNHVLPTNGYARAFSGVNLDSYYKKITFQQASRKGLQGIGHDVMAMAEAEALEAHRLAVKLRLEE